MGGIWAKVGPLFVQPALRVATPSINQQAKVALF